MKLKTLRELQEKWIDYQMNDDDKAMILDLFDDLKGEAVKWIKELKRVDIEYTPFDEKNKNELRKKVFEDIFGIEIVLDDEYDWQYVMRDFLVSFIKHFFNLTEEELSK